MKLIFTLFIGLTFVTFSFSQKNDSNNSLEPEIVVKNKADYSENFIQGLKQLGYRKIKLVDNLILLEDIDTNSFPKTPKLGEHLVYTGRKDNIAIAVTVKRINYTTIDYKIEMVEYGKSNYLQEGKADIASTFYYGTESDEYEGTSEAYFVTEFADYRTDDCYTFIRIGVDNDVAKIIQNCNGKIKDITLENFTTLRRK